MDARLKSLSVVLTMAFVAGVATTASAATISWTLWTSGQLGATTGSAVGSIPGLGINVNYSGEFSGFNFPLDVWLPVSSFTGGTVDNAPPINPGAGIPLTGGAATGTNTVTFSTPVVNPIVAIWSLGQPGLTARFTFLDSYPLSIQGGGPNSYFGGASIFAGGTCPAFSICGTEGNGIVQLTGTFSSISWTNPIFENFYKFTVGVTGPGPAVPEPASWALLGTGLFAAAAYRRRARGRAVNAASAVEPRR